MRDDDDYLTRFKLGGTHSLVTTIELMRWEALDAIEIIDPALIDYLNSLTKETP